VTSQRNTCFVCLQNYRGTEARKRLSRSWHCRPLCPGWLSHRCGSVLPGGVGDGRTLEGTAEAICSLSWCPASFCFSAWLCLLIFQFLLGSGLSPLKHDVFVTWWFCCKYFGVASSTPLQSAYTIL